MEFVYNKDRKIVMEIKLMMINIFHQVVDYYKIKMHKHVEYQLMNLYLNMDLLIKF